MIAPEAFCLRSANAVPKSLTLGILANIPVFIDLEEALASSLTAEVNVSK